MNRRCLVVGIIDILVGLTCFILCIILNRTDRIILTFFPVAIGLGNITAYISDKKQDKKKRAELAEKWGVKDE